MVEASELGATVINNEYAPKPRKLGRIGKASVAFVAVVTSVGGSTLLLNESGSVGAPAAAEAGILAKPDVNNVDDGPWGTGPDPCTTGSHFVGWAYPNESVPFHPRICAPDIDPYSTAPPFPTWPNNSVPPGYNGNRATPNKSTPTTIANKIEDKDHDLFTVTIDHVTGQAIANPAYGIVEINDNSQGNGLAGMIELNQDLVARGIDETSYTPEIQAFITDVGYTDNPSDWESTLKYVGIDLLATPLTTIEAATTVSATSTSTFATAEELSTTLPESTVEAVTSPSESESSNPAIILSNSNKSSPNSGGLIRDIEIFGSAAAAGLGLLLLSRRRHGPESGSKQHPNQAGPVIGSH